MSHIQRAAGIVGALLLGVSVTLVARGNEEQERSSPARRSDRQIDELADELKQAWAGHHTP